MGRRDRLKLCRLRAQGTADNIALLRGWVRVRWGKSGSRAV